MAVKDKEAATNAAPKTETIETPKAKSTDHVVPTLTSIHQMFNAPSNLSEAGQAVKNAFKEQAKIKGYGIHEDMYQAFESLTLSCAADAVVVIFQETHHNYGTDARPATDRIYYEILPRLKQRGERLLETIVVTPADYSRVGMLIHMMDGLLNREKRAALNEVTTESFKRIPKQVDLNIHNVREYINSRSPHAVQGPIDVGFLFNWQNTTDSNDPMNRDLPYLPLFGVGGYTRFVQYTSPEGVKYQPITIITEIVTDFPSLAMTAMALPLAAYVFLCANQWQSPYGFTQKDMNLGNLLLDKATNKPISLESQDEWDKLAPACFLPPVLAIDVTEGRFRIPGLETIANPRKDNQVLDVMENFLRPELPTNAVLAAANGMVISKYGSYTGVGQLNGVLKDTREVNFLKMIKATGDYNACLPLLMVGQFPEEEFNKASAMMVDATPLFGTQTFILDNNVLNDIAGPLMSAGILPTQLPTSNAMYQYGNTLITGIVSSGAGDYSQLGSTMAPAGGGRWTPWGIL